SAIYPEYLTDPAIVFCPSDSTDTVAEVYDANGTVNLNLKRDTSQGQYAHQHTGVKAIDASYTYAPVVYDRLNKDFINIAGNPLLNVIAQLNLNPLPANITQAPAQFVEAMDDLLSRLANDLNNPAQF